MIKSDELKALDAALDGALSDIVSLFEFKGKKVSEGRRLHAAREQHLYVGSSLLEMLSAPYLGGRSVAATSV